MSLSKVNFYKTKNKYKYHYKTELEQKLRRMEKTITFYLL